MRLLAWNIRQGGGSRLARIAAALDRHEADILVLSEYRGGQSAMRLLAVLDGLGYRYATTLILPPGRTGVLIAARCAFREHGTVGPDRDRHLPLARERAGRQGLLPRLQRMGLRIHLGRPRAAVLRRTNPDAASGLRGRGGAPDRRPRLPGRTRPPDGCARQLSLAAEISCCPRMPTRRGRR